MDRELLESVEDLGVVSDINVTPFIDIMLVLLIIFMVTAPLMLGGVDVSLPKAAADPLPRPENPVVVTLDARRRVFVDQEEVPPLRRPEFFRGLARNSDSGTVYVRGDGEARYAEVMALMAELGQAGFARVALVTDNRPGGPGALKPAAGESANTGAAQ